MKKKTIFISIITIFIFIVIYYFPKSNIIQFHDSNLSISLTKPSFYYDENGYLMPNNEVYKLDIKDEEQNKVIEAIFNETKYIPSIKNSTGFTSFSNQDFEYTILIAYIENNSLASIHLLGDNRIAIDKDKTTLYYMTNPKILKKLHDYIMDNQ